MYFGLVKARYIRAPVEKFMSVAPVCIYLASFGVSDGCNGAAKSFSGPIYIMLYCW